MVYQTIDEFSEHTPQEWDRIAERLKNYGPALMETRYTRVTSPPKPLGNIAYGLRIPIWFVRGIRDLLSPKQRRYRDRKLMPAPTPFRDITFSIYALVRGKKYRAKPWKVVLEFEQPHAILEPYRK